MKLFAIKTNTEILTNDRYFKPMDQISDGEILVFVNKKTVESFFQNINHADARIVELSIGIN